ncbi:MAG: 3-phosphoshikimate 1-carboxyvinyltransferase [Chloroflexota bacterium]|nr:3-phosphoshikimate 1-carboxyvinyltransferase [Chloroflexota bacterium]MDE2941655.1 3-phosphoshikimate 1-carboxyvinyltransferase [Chloroflexota bacterium]MDE3267298.1 3-phosphoshikimate 1-carboxyvinyltransferase [Chloroflexota bacterium]
MNRSVLPAGELSGTLSPPADKSVSHRAAILNSLAAGSVTVHNYSEGADCRSTLECLRLLGVTAEVVNPAEGSEEEPKLVLTSPGLENFNEPETVLDAQNSGTTMRFIMGLLGSTPFLSVVTGDRSLRARPMGRVVQPLRLMGAQVMGRGSDSLAPLAIRGGDLNGIEYTMPVASAQLKSALLMAALFANGETVLLQPALSRDHTERMLRAMGADVVEDGLALVVRPGPKLTPMDITVSGDISSAAFWLVAGAVHPNARIRLSNVGVNPSRTGVLDVLRDMGASVTEQNARMEGGEPVADLMVESSELRGVEIGGDMIPIVQDEVPVLALAAALARGTTTIRDAQELRYKESDRLHATATELTKLGAKISELPDGLVIEGSGALQGGACDSHGDHRLAMTLGIAGLVTREAVDIADADVVDISYPGFWGDLDSLRGD